MKAPGVTKEMVGRWQSKDGKLDCSSMDYVPFCGVSLEDKCGQTYTVQSGIGVVLRLAFAASNCQECFCSGLFGSEIPCAWLAQVISAIGTKQCGRRSVLCNLLPIPRRFASLANVPMTLAGEDCEASKEATRMDLENKTFGFLLA